MTSTLPAHLQPDCAACCGLCCVALPFDATQGFGFDKAAHTPCQHLESHFRCGIHNDLTQRGFSGCVQYNCHGAGQATMRLFNKVAWTDSLEHAERMFDIFSRLRPLHELMAMLSLALTHAESAQKETLQNAFDQLGAACRNETSITDNAKIASLKSAAQLALHQFSGSPGASSLVGQVKGL
jgi:hypothetical protein